MLTDIFNFLTPDLIITFFKEQVATNQFSQGAIVAGLIGAVLAWGRAVPGKVWNFLVRTCTIDVRFNSDSPDYAVVARYITENMVREWFSRKFVFQTDTTFDTELYRKVASTRGLTAGYGTHFGLFKGWPVLIERSLEESAQTKEFKETTSVTFLGRSKKRIYKFADELKRVTGNAGDTFEKVPVYINDGGWWDRMGKLPLRRLTSVFTANNAGQEVVELIRSFESKKEENHRLGLPHHLGIMLHGKAGCGKSSLIHAVASETERSIYYLNLGSVDSDKELTSLLAGSRANWSKTILAIEDIDAAGVKVSRGKEETKTKGKKKKQKEEEEKSKISLSALLNVLDGILCPDGLVVIATTNHHEDLDTALVRSGRFDHTIELGKLGYDDFSRMAKMFGRDPADFDVANDVQMTGSDMRAIIMEAA